MDEPLLQVKTTFPNRGTSSRKRRQRQQECLYKKIGKLGKEKETLSRKAKRLQKQIERGKKSISKLPATPNSSARQQLAKEGINSKSCKKFAKKILYAEVLSKEIKEAALFNKKKSICNVINGKILKKNKLLNFTAKNTGMDGRLSSKASAKSSKVTPRESRFNEKLHSAVRDFYDRDDNSTSLPRKRDFKKVESRRFQDDFSTISSRTFT